MRRMKGQKLPGIENHFVQIWYRLNILIPGWWRYGAEAHAAVLVALITKYHFENRDVQATDW